MIPTVFTIPWLNMPIRGYGLMLMIGFLAATWWAARRAERVKCNPDLIINMGFVALIAAVVGSRLFFVVHYWERNFAGRGLWAIVDITAGGMEFYGGFLAGTAALILFLWFKGVSVRVYTDIIAPSVMLGMGIARIGCFLNGCCWGGLCSEHLPWAVRFPYGSPATYRQWEERQLTLPEELIYVTPDGWGSLIPRDQITLDLQRREKAEAAYARAAKALEDAKTANADDQTLARLGKQLETAKRHMDDQRQKTAILTIQESRFRLTHAQLRELADAPGHKSLAVHPSQLYASANGFLLAAILSAYFYRRRRHGMVLALLLVLYPITRVVEEIIRVDNAYDTAGLTVSQFVSVSLLVLGLAYIYALHRLPARCPKAVPCLPWRDMPRPSRKK